jgi:hypothetical protein
MRIDQENGIKSVVAEAGFDSLERLLKNLTALAELTHKLAKKPWALWLGLGIPHWGAYFFRK